MGDISGIQKFTQSGAVTTNVTTAESQSETYTRYFGVDGVKQKKRSEAYLRLLL